MSPNAVTRITAASRTTVTEVNALGRPTKVTVQGALNLAPTAMTYYGAADGIKSGRLKTVTQTDGVQTRLYTLDYDGGGNLLSIAGPLNRTVLFSYDQATRVTSKTFPDNEQVRFFYDHNGNLERLAQPGTPLLIGPADAHDFVSDNRDMLQTYNPPAIGLPNHDTTFLYTADAELDRVTRPDALTVDPSYDAAGRLSGVVAPGNTIAYNYFANGDPTAPGKLEQITTSQDGVTIGYTYAGRLLTSTAWSGPVSGLVSLTYDNDLRVTSDTVAGDTATYVYGDADGLLTQER